MNERKWYWATRKVKNWKVIVTEDGDQYFGFFLPEWIKDGRVRRRFKGAARVEFVCPKDDVVLGERVSVEQTWYSEPIYDKPEYSDRIIKPIGFKQYFKLIIDGVDYSREAFVANV